jgi:hypothetical protein
MEPQNADSRVVSRIIRLAAIDANLLDRIPRKLYNVKKLIQEGTMHCTTEVPRVNQGTGSCIVITIMQMSVLFII